MIRLFRVFVPIGPLALLSSEILLVTSSFILATYLVLKVDPTVYLLYDGGLVRILLALASILLGMHFQDLYSKIYVRSRLVLAQQLCLVIGIAFLSQALIGYLDADLRVPIGVMMLGSLLALVVIFAWRLFFSAYVLRVVAQDRLLLVGASPLLEDIGKHIEESPETGLQVVGYLDDRAEIGTPIAGGNVLGPVASLREIVQATRPDRIVVGMTERRTRMPVSELLDLRFAGHIIEEAASTYEKVCGRVCLKELRPSQLIYSGELGPRRASVFYQTAINVVLAAIGLVVATPIMLLTALAVRLTSAGPVLYRQVRVGLNGRPFTLYKFRSMRTDAEAETGAVWASKDDPRVTFFGRIIRKLRIDEIPQLFNVLKGEMSVVGPRPERPEMVDSLSEKIPVLPPPPLRAAWNHGLGPSQLQIRRYPGRCHPEVGVRSLLHQAHVAVAGQLHHLPHDQGHSVIARRAIVAPGPELHPALDGGLRRDLVVVQDAPSGPLQRGSRLHIRVRGAGFGGPRLGQQALILDDEKAGGGTHVELGLLGLERLLPQLARFHRRFVRRSRAARILHLEARQVRLRNPVMHRPDDR